MAMGIALQLLFTGLRHRRYYALVALGFVLIYRATNVVNCARGDFATLGAFSMVVLCIDMQLCDSNRDDWRELLDSINSMPGSQSRRNVAAVVWGIREALGLEAAYALDICQGTE